MSDAREDHIHHALLDGVIGRRFLGWLIDLLIIGVAEAVLSLIVGLLGLLTFGLGWWLFGGFWVIPILYAWLFVSSAQALVWAILYWFLLWISGGLLIIVVFFTTHKRALHDLLSGLTVVRADGARSLAGPRAA